MWTISFRNQPEDLAKGTTSHSVHGTGLKVNQDSLYKNLAALAMWHNLSETSLRVLFFHDSSFLAPKASFFLYPWDIFSTRSLVEVNIDSFQLDLCTISAIRASRVNPMLVAKTLLHSQNFFNQARDVHLPDYLPKL